MYNKEIESLRIAESDLERTWVITRYFLESLSPELTDTVLRAAVPHWFTPPILAILLNLTEDAASVLIDQMLSFPFVEPFGNLGLTIHDLTRAAILSHLVDAEPELLHDTSERAVLYFSSKNDPQHSVEYLYHYICLNPKEGIHKFRRQERYFRNTLNFSAASNLLRNIQEILDLKIIIDKNISIEVERQNYLIASKQLDEAQNSKKHDEAQKHFGEAAKFFGIKIDEGKSQRQIDITRKNTYLEIDFILKKVKEAEGIEDKLKQSMWLCELGVAYWSTYEYKKSLKYLNLAIESGEVYDLTLAFRGYTYARLRKFKAAFIDLNKALELNENDVYALSDRGHVYYLKKNYEAAALDLNRAIELDERDDWTLAVRGDMYRLTKNYKAAIKDFNAAIKIDPNYMWARSKRVATYLAMKDYPSALEDLNKIIELDSKHPWAYRTRVIPHIMTGKFKLALLDVFLLYRFAFYYIWQDIVKTYTRFANYLSRKKIF